MKKILVTLVLVLGLVSALTAKDYIQFTNKTIDTPVITCAHINKTYYKIDCRGVYEFKDEAINQVYGKKLNDKDFVRFELVNDIKTNHPEFKYIFDEIQKFKLADFTEFDYDEMKEYVFGTTSDYILDGKDSISGDVEIVVSYNSSVAFDL